MYINKIEHKVFYKEGRKLFSLKLGILYLLFYIPVVGRWIHL